MTTLNCGCRIMSDIINLNGEEKSNRIYWSYNLKTFVNICGKCGKKQMKFNYMENKLMEMERARMAMFLEDNEDKEEEETFFELEELKEHLKTLRPEERHKVKDFERLRNLANGLDPNEGLEEIDMVIRELEEEERVNEIERRTEENTIDPYDCIMSPRSREEYDKWNEEEGEQQPEPEEDSDNESVDIQTQRNRQMFESMLWQPETNPEQ